MCISKYASFRIRTDVAVNCKFELTEEYDEKKNVVEVKPGASETATYFSYDYDNVKSGAKYIAEFKCSASGYEDLKKELVYYAQYGNDKYSSDFVKIDVNGCEDSDGGINYFKKGSIIDYNYDFQESYSTTDYCDVVGTGKIKWLVEQKCVEGYPPIETIRFECENGCEDGACIKENNGDNYEEEHKYKDEDKYEDDKNDDKYEDDNKEIVDIKYISPEIDSIIESKYFEFSVNTDEANCDIDVTEIVGDDYKQIETDKSKYSTSTYHIFKFNELTDDSKLKIELECDADNKEDIRKVIYYYVNYDESDYDSDFIGIDIEGCEDSDGGIDYFSKGVVVDYSFADKGVITNTVDYCDPVTSNDDDVKDILIEYSCKSDYPMAEGKKFWCENGCSNGACRDNDGNVDEGFTATCFDSDGDDIFVKGNVSVKILEIGNIDVQHDRCNGAFGDDDEIYYDGVIEYGCSSDNILEYSVLECNNGCRNGLCLKN